MNRQTGMSALQPRVNLLTEAKVLRLHTSPSGREITGVVVEVKGKLRERYAKPTAR